MRSIVDILSELRPVRSILWFTDDVLTPQKAVKFGDSSARQHPHVV